MFQTYTERKIERKEHAIREKQVFQKQIYQLYELVIIIGKPRLDYRRGLLNKVKYKCKKCNDIKTSCIRDILMNNGICQICEIEPNYVTSLIDSLENISHSISNNISNNIDIDFNFLLPEIVSIVLNYLTISDIKYSFRNTSVQFIDMDDNIYSQIQNNNKINPLSTNIFFVLRDNQKSMFYVCINPFRNFELTIDTLCRIHNVLVRPNLTIENLLKNLGAYDGFLLIQPITGKRLHSNYKLYDYNINNDTRLEVTIKSNDINEISPNINQNIDLTNVYMC